MNAEYADETYWFLRNKKGDIISKKLFNEKKFQHTMTVIAQCSHILKWSLLRNSIRRQNHPQHHAVQSDEPRGVRRSLSLSQHSFAQGQEASDEDQAIHR